MTTEESDTPKVVATIMWTSPGLVLRSGLAYLRMKRLARESSDRFRSSLESSGMPPERARQLSDEYGTDLSISRFMGGFVKHKGPDAPR